MSQAESRPEEETGRKPNPFQMARGQGDVTGKRKETPVSHPPSQRKKPTPLGAPQLTQESMVESLVLRPETRGPDPDTDGVQTVATPPVPKKARPKRGCILLSHLKAALHEEEEERDKDLHRMDAEVEAKVIGMGTKSPNPATDPDLRMMLEKGFGKKVARRALHTSAQEIAIHALKGILMTFATLIQEDENGVFLFPVQMYPNRDSEDPNDRDVFKDYDSIVRKPMDFGTIFMNLYTLAYTNVEQVQNDVCLILSNCRLYHGKQGGKWKNERLVPLCDEMEKTASFQQLMNVDGRRNLQIPLSSTAEKVNEGRITRGRAFRPLDPIRNGLLLDGLKKSKAFLTEDLEKEHTQGGQAEVLFHSVLSLLCRNVDINYKHHEGGQTALMLASQNSVSETTVRLLVHLGADLNLKDENDMTALHWACYKGCFGIVKYLLEKGADVCLGDQTLWTGTPMVVAMTSDHKHHREVVTLLLKDMVERKRKEGEGEGKGISFPAVSHSPCPLSEVLGHVHAERTVRRPRSEGEIKEGEELIAMLETLKKGKGQPVSSSPSSSGAASSSSSSSSKDGTEGKGKGHETETETETETDQEGDGEKESPADTRLFVPADKETPYAILPPTPNGTEPAPMTDYFMQEAIASLDRERKETETWKTKYQILIASWSVVGKMDLANENKKLKEKVKKLEGALSQMQGIIDTVQASTSDSSLSPGPTS